MLKKQFIVISLFTSAIVCSNTGQALADTVISNDTLHIQTLAASCAACHGTQGNAVGGDSVEAGKSNTKNAILAGVDPAEFTEKMLGFKDGSRKATVMHHHAKGLTIDEINQLALHFSQQKRVAKAALKSQTLKADHE